MASHGVPRTAVAERTEEGRKKEVQKIEQYRNLVAQVLSRRKAQDFSTETLTLNTKLLRQNPEFYTIWNHRREILLHIFPDPPSSSAASTTTTDTSNTAPDEAPFPQRAYVDRLLDLINADLEFLLPLLMQYPKCYWIWNHRLWLLQTASARLPAADAAPLWRTELTLDSKMLARDARNFHGWSYRRIIVAALTALEGDSATADEHAPPAQPDTQPPALPPSTKENPHDADLLAQETAYTDHHVRLNLSNYSAWHQRSKLLPQLLRRRRATPDERRARLAAEFDLVANALGTDPWDQSLWFYHDFLLATVRPTSDANTNQHDRLVLDLAPAERAARYAAELAWIRDVLNDTDDCKWLVQALLRIAEDWHAADPVEAARHLDPVEMRDWLARLRRLDPLRRGRWEDWGRKLGLEG